MSKCWTYKNLSSIHMELSSACNAACPGCRRFTGNSPNVNPQLIQRSVSIEEFKKWFPHDLMLKINSWLFCGTYGDPMAAPDIYEILQYTCQYSGSVQLNTNGGLRSEKLYKRIGELFVNSSAQLNHTTPYRAITFSIDGLADTNHIYRRNVVWDKVWANLMAYTKTNARSQWDFLKFKHNIHQIDEAKALANKHNISLVLKNPFGLDKMSMPAYNKDMTLDYVIEHATDNGYPAYTPSPINWIAPLPKKIEEEGIITCDSKNQNTEETLIYINSLGYVLPCCFVAVGTNGSDFDWGRQTQKIQADMGEINNVDKYPLAEILDNGVLEVWSNSWKDKSINVCWNTCGKNSSKKRQMDTLWVANPLLTSSKKLDEFNNRIPDDVRKENQMSEYNKNADEARKQLGYISSSMCYAKWAQTSLHLTNGKTNSCYHPPLHSMNVEQIKQNFSALHNTDQKKLERKMMLNGEKPPGCQYCWKIEEVGGRSDRIYRSGESWAQNSKKDIVLAMDTGDISPRYVEVNFNQACNFKCMYCSPHLSTTWEDEVKKHGPYKIEDIKGKVELHNSIEYLERDGLMPFKGKQEDNPYLDAFWKWWPSLYKKLEVFRITGGEPLMDVNTFRVLDYMYENPNAWLEFSITTNMCPPKQELMDKFIEKLKLLERIQIWEDKSRHNPGSGNNWYVNMAIKHFSLFISLDSVGEQAEYIRSGLNYGQLQSNVLNFLDNTDNTAVTFINTYNALSVPKTTEFMKYILSLRTRYSQSNQGTKSISIYDPHTKHPDHIIHPRQRIWLDIPLLRNPEWQNIQLLPESFDHYIEEAIAFMKENVDTSSFVGFYDFEIAKLERNLAMLRENRYAGDVAKMHRSNMRDFFAQYDDRKGTDFNKTFPEFRDINK